MRIGGGRDKWVGHQDEDAEMRGASMILRTFSPPLYANVMNCWAQIRTAVVQGLRWGRAIGKLGWRVDVQMHARAVSDLNRPCAVVELSTEKKSDQVSHHPCVPPLPRCSFHISVYLYFLPPCISLLYKSTAPTCGCFGSASDLLYEEMVDGAHMCDFVLVEFLLLP